MENTPQKPPSFIDSLIYGIESLISGDFHEVGRSSGKAFER
jgi:hypothetical protein